MDPQITQIPQKEKTLFPLDAERVVKLKLGGALYAHVFRPCTEEEAREFFRASMIELCLGFAASRSGGEGRDAEAPRRALYAALILRVEGYRVKGGGEISALPKWQERIPLAHRMLALDRVTQVAPDESETSMEIEPEYDVTILSALGYSGLVHRFEPVTAEDQHAFNRDSTKAKAIGGSRTGATLAPAWQNILIRLYNKKIRQVEGYKFGGDSAIAGISNGDGTGAVIDIPAIVAQVDPFHKVAAIQPLFHRIAVDETEEASDLAALIGEAKRAALESENDSND